MDMSLLIHIHYKLVEVQVVYRVLNGTGLRAFHTDICRAISCCQVRKSIFRITEVCMFCSSCISASLHPHWFSRLSHVFSPHRSWPCHPEGHAEAFGQHPEWCPLLPAQWAAGTAGALEATQGHHAQTCPWCCPRWVPLDSRHNYLPGFALNWIAYIAVNLTDCNWLCLPRIALLLNEVKR